MAFMKPKEEEETAAAPSEGGSQAVTFGAPAPQQRAAQAQPTGPKQEGSGQFTNLKQFLDANAGKSQAYAQDVTSGMETEAKNLESDITKAGKTGAAGITSIASSPDVDVSKITNTNSEAFKSAQSSLAAPVEFGQETAAAKSALSSFNPNVEKVTKAVELTKTGSGLSQLTGEKAAEKGVTLSSGEKNFNRILLGLDPNAQQKFQALQKDVPANLAKANTAAQALIDKAATDRATIASGARSKLSTDINTQYGGIKSGVEGDVSGINTSAGRDFLAGTALLRDEANDPTGANAAANMAIRMQFDDLVRQYGGRSVGGEGWESNLNNAQLAQVNALRQLKGEAPITRTYDPRRLNTQGIQKALDELQRRQEATTIQRNIETSPGNLLNVMNV